MNVLQTEYRGQIYRSRTEAKWAAVLTHAADAWQFEPREFKIAKGVAYWPDFYLPEVNTFIEIKPSLPSPIHFLKAQELAKLGERVFVINGEPRIIGYKDNYTFRCDTFTRVLPEGVSQLVHVYDDCPVFVEELGLSRLPDVLGAVLDDLKAIQNETPPPRTLSLKHFGRELSDQLAGWTKRTHSQQNPRPPIGRPGQPNPN